MKRQRYSTKFKVQVTKEAEEVGNASAVARRYELSNALLYRWMREYKEGRYDGVEGIGSIRDNGVLSKENDHLKQLLGEKDLEIAILRDLIKKKNPHLLKRLK